MWDRPYNIPCLFLITIAFILVLPFLAGDSPFSSSCETVIAERVIDGDTFVTKKGMRIRLVGIDTPETTDSNRDVEWFGLEAARKLKTLIEQKELCLRKDDDQTTHVDRYGRLLRYVWIEERLINAELVSEGYAFAYTYKPFRYLDEFRKLARDARENKRGLWNSNARKNWLKTRRKEVQLSHACGTEETICPERAGEYADKSATVRFFVRKTKNIRNMVFLNSENDYKEDTNFSVVIFRRDLLQFMKDPSETYLNRTIDVTGQISLYKKKPQMIITSPDQIKMVNQDYFR